MPWKTADEQLREEAARARAMSPDERLKAAFDLERFAFELLRDQDSLPGKMKLLERIEEEGKERIRAWIRRHRAR